MFTLTAVATSVGLLTVTVDKGLLKGQKTENITAFLRSVHRLPLCYKIDVKGPLLVVYE